LATTAVLEVLFPFILLNSVEEGQNVSGQQIFFSPMEAAARRRSSAAIGRTGGRASWRMAHVLSQAGAMKDDVRIRAFLSLLIRVICDSDCC
jgi:hypothetical protein